jgi:hypothetical protein
MAIIKSPNKKYNGCFAGVTFVNGQTETDDPHKIAWFKKKGYEVTEEAKKTKTKKEKAEKEQE